MYMYKLARSLHGSKIDDFIELMVPILGFDEGRGCCMYMEYCVKLETLIVQY